MNSNNKNTVVITDTSCLIILTKNLLQLLKDIFDVVITTPEIVIEFGSALPYWIVVNPVINRALQKELAENVDSGEASAIALAHEIENDFVITDDLKARKLCAKLGLPFIGTLGVLLRAKEHGDLKEIRPILEEAKKTNFRLTEELYNTVLRKAGEL